MEIRHADLQIEVEDAEDGGVLLEMGKETLRFEKAELALVRLRIVF